MEKEILNELILIHNTNSLHCLEQLSETQSPLRENQFSLQKNQ